MNFKTRNIYSIHNIVVYIVFTLVLIPTTISKFTYVVDDLHWLGSEAAYDYWIDNNFLWGETIIQNVGPLGFIHFPLSFTGIMDYEGTIANIILSITLVVTTILLSTTINCRFYKFIFLSIFTILQIYKNKNGLPEIVEVNHYLICLYIFYSTIIFNFTIIPLAIILATMSLGKGMFLFIALFALLSVSLIKLIQKRYIHTLIFFTTFIFAWIAIWLFLKQKLYYIDDFIINSFKFSEGYNQSLSNNYFQSNLLITCFIVAIILEILIFIKVYIIFRHKKNICNIITIIFEQFILFAVWKHAIVSSAQYHLGIFIFFAFMFLPSICLIWPKYDQNN